MERIINADESWIMNPEVFRVNREDAHSDHAFYEEKVTEYGSYSYIKYRVPHWHQQQNKSPLRDDWEASSGALISYL